MLLSLTMLAVVAVIIYICIAIDTHHHNQIHKALWYDVMVSRRETEEKQVIIKQGIAKRVSELHDMDRRLSSLFNQSRR